MFVPQVCVNVTNAITVIVILFIFIFPALMMIITMTMIIVMIMIINMINIIIRERLGWLKEWVDIIELWSPE